MNSALCLCARFWESKQVLESLDAAWVSEFLRERVALSYVNLFDPDIAGMFPCCVKSPMLSS